MQVGRRYSFYHTANWTKKYILIFLIWGAVPVLLDQFFGWKWLHLPWQPISLIGIAVAFYLGFKNNSSYDRLWEARKIWGGIVNASRSFTVMARDFVNNDEAIKERSHDELKQIRRELVDLHLAWLHALTLEMRKLKSWEHQDKSEQFFRKQLDTEYAEEKMQTLKKYLNPEDLAYVLSKGNRSSHLLSLCSKRMMELRQAGIIEHFRHLEMQGMITELYTLQGKSERIKNFPFPRQYATVNYFFAVLFIVLLPFGMMDVFSEMGGHWIWLSIPFTAVCSWVFWMMEMIGDYSENPFEGLYNDVPITSMAVGIERDILQMLDETDLPDPIGAVSEMKIVV